MQALEDDIDNPDTRHTRKGAFLVFSYLEDGLESVHRHQEDTEKTSRQ